MTALRRTFGARLGRVVVGLLVGTVALAASNGATHVGAVPPEPETPEPDWPVRVLIAGDSTGAGLIAPMRQYALDLPGRVEVFHSAFAGCGLTAAGDGRLHQWNNEREWIDLSGCLTQWDGMVQRIGDEQIDVVVVSTGIFDGNDIAFPDGRRTNLLDPTGRALVESAYADFADGIAATGARIVWVTPPDIDRGWEQLDDLLDDPARWSTLREIIADVDAVRVGVRQVDLPGWLGRTGLDGPAGRSDGSHLDPAPAEQFVGDLLGPSVLVVGGGRLGPLPG